MCGYAHHARNGDREIRDILLRVRRQIHAHRLQQGRRHRHKSTQTVFD